MSRDNGNSVNKEINPFYDERFNYYYASETNLGGPIVRIIKPDITPEENEKRKQAFIDTLAQILLERTGILYNITFVKKSDVA
jgi:hypothetical protein